MRKIWVKAPGPLKLTAAEKDLMVERVRNLVVASKTLAQVTSRIDLQNGRVFLYFLYQPASLEQPSNTNSATLIEGKYIEGCYARITLFKADGFECAAEFERQAGQWVTAREGSLETCLKFIEEKDTIQCLFTRLDVKRNPKVQLLSNKDL